MKRFKKFMKAIYRFLKPESAELSLEEFIKLESKKTNYDWKYERKFYL